MAVTLLAVVVGVSLLAFAADQFVLGAARVALLRQIPALVVGVVIIGFGTSLPELLVSTLGAAGNHPEVAIGNIVGSNIANLSLLLGFGAIMIPIGVDSATVRREGLLTFAAMVGFAVVVRGGGISAPEGLALLAGMAVALFAVTRRDPIDPLGPETEALAEASQHSLRAEVIRTVVGLAGTIGGAQLLLWGATDLAARLGVSEGFIGVTMVAVGTSLPELVTVIQSARRHQTDLIVGNLLGSNLFNALVVGGTVGVIGSPQIDLPSLTTIAPIAAVGVALVAVGAMATGRQVDRREGILLLIAYCAIVPFLA